MLFSKSESASVLRFDWQVGMSDCLIVGSHSLFLDSVMGAKSVLLVISTCVDMDSLESAAVFDLYTSVSSD